MCETDEPQKAVIKRICFAKWLIGKLDSRVKKVQKVPEMTPAIVSFYQRPLILNCMSTSQVKHSLKADTDQLAERIEKNVTEYLG